SDLQAPVRSRARALRGRLGLADRGRDSARRVGRGRRRRVLGRRDDGERADHARSGAGPRAGHAGLEEGAGAAFSAVATTESALITLDPELAAAGVFPALRPDD